MTLVRRGFDSLGATLLAGLLILLPIALTLIVLGWVVSLIYQFIGPGSLIGRLFAAIGYPFSSNPALAYLVGASPTCWACWRASAGRAISGRWPTAPCAAFL